MRPRLPGIGPSPSSAAVPKAFATDLRIPEVITDRTFEISMQEAEVEVLPGPPTRMWTYGGTFPGPTVRRPAAEPGEDPTEATFSHDLPSEAGELTVHLHGGHNRSDDDGQPGAPPASPGGAFCDLSGAGGDEQSPLLIRPGESRTYTHELVEDGGPERSAFQWYHDHRCDRTAKNVWMGLAGMWIVDDETDSSLGLPSGERDIPLLICDRSIKADNQLADPFGGFGGHPPNDGLKGKYVLVNGSHLPRHRVEGRRHRLRVLNASQFRSYNLALSNGASMTQISTEGGLMPKALKRKRILVGPGERVEVVVDFGDFSHRDVELVSVRRRDGREGSGSKAYEGPLMQFRIGGRRPDATRVPEQLRPLPDWVSGAPAAPQKSWEVGIEGLKWVINGESYDPDYVEHSPAIDTTETWRLKNKTSVAHLIHLHHTDWYMLERNGRRPSPWERCLKETFFLDPRDEVLVAGRFSDHLGKFAVHCHMLDHEDHGLMSQFEVVPA